MKRDIILIYVALCTMLCFTGCTQEKATEQPPKTIPVKVQTVGYSDQVQSRNYVGTIEASSALSVAFSGMGTVERVLVAEGDRVQKGQLLAVLNSGTAQSAYDVAKSTLHQAQDAYNRLKPLHEQGSLTPIKWVEVESGLEKAKAMEAIAKKGLDDCSLYAPMGGVVAKRSVEEGVNAIPGVSAFKIVSMDEVDIKVSIPENEISDIRVGQQARATVLALGSAEYMGSVRQKGVEGHPVSRTYDVRIRVQNRGSELMPGMVCNVSLQSGAEHNVQTIVIPNRAVQVAHNGQHFVWIAENGVAKRQFVATGGLSAYGVAIESGLSGGERLIVEGYQKVSEGMRVTF